MGCRAQPGGNKPGPGAAPGSGVSASPRVSPLTDGVGPRRRGRNTKDPLSDPEQASATAGAARTQGTAAGRGEAQRGGDTKPRFSSSWQGAPRGGRGKVGASGPPSAPGQTSGPLTKDGQTRAQGAEQSRQEVVHKPLHGDHSLKAGGGTGWGTRDRVQAREDGVGVLQALIPKLLLCQRREEYLLTTQ